MDFNTVNEGLTVSSQIQPEDFATLAAKGFRAVINNRPDNEVGAEIGSTAMQAAAEAAGLAYVYLPIFPGQFTPELVAQTGRLMAELDGPVYAYCRSGTRSVTAWALAQAGQTSVDDILKQAAGAGYDLSPMTAYLTGQ